MSLADESAASSTLDFYRRLSALTSFADATNISHFVELPDDWAVVITDVIGSTKAIEAGAYKDVNTVGVACIAALSNIDRELYIPYVFGGDGVTAAVPLSKKDEVRHALLAAQVLARRGFGLDLRLGFVPATALRAKGHWVRLAKIQLSEHVMQPALAGRGWEVAERWVKDPDTAIAFGVSALPGEKEEDFRADFTGFECRWQGVAAFNGHKLALLVLAMGQNPVDNMRVYENVLQRLAAIYGDERDYHPLRTADLRLSTRWKGVAGESTVRTFGKGTWTRWFYAMKALLQNRIATRLFRRQAHKGAVQWHRYRDELVENTDFRKFDGMLRMVIDGRDDQTAALRQWLEEERRLSRLVFGMHKSKEALVTCIVRSYNGNHQHFVDGSDGGYALAARELKEQLKSQAQLARAS